MQRATSQGEREESAVIALLLSAIRQQKQLFVTFE
jgi:hypothetical protein